MSKDNDIVQVKKLTKLYQQKSVKLSLIIGVFAAYVHYTYIADGKPKQMSTLVTLAVFSVASLLLIKRLARRLSPSSRWRYFID